MDQIEKVNTTMSNKAYNIVATPLAAATKGTNANGKSKITFRAKATVGGREIERTVIAQGAAADKIENLIEVGKDVALRVLFERAPANDDGSKGGEYLTVVDLPRAKAA